MSSLIGDVLLVARRDLAIERRSKVILDVVLPFAVVVVILFAFALDPDTGTLTGATPGLFWTTVLFSTLLTVQRQATFDASPGVRGMLLSTQIEPAAMFLGKVAAATVFIVALEAGLALAVALLYGPDVSSAASLVGGAALIGSLLFGAVAMGASGTLYASLTASVGAREALLPMLVLPLCSPLVLSATQASAAVLDGRASEAWRWLGLLAAAASFTLVLGAWLFEHTLEDA
ncbi:MAG: hypothetical protein KatS3mg008_0899 [Acidimicrobiales bacterium]|nr:MAG: hypothetical protein KatS3mg008_0899 [Acidimicrobiales bacterium]